MIYITLMNKINPECDFSSEKEARLAFNALPALTCQGRVVQAAVACLRDPRFRRRVIWRRRAMRLVGLTDPFLDEMAYAISAGNAAEVAAE